MSERKHKAKRAEVGEQQEERQSEDDFEKFLEELSEIALLVEAAGNFERAVRLGWSAEEKEGVDIEAVRQMVPVSRGGGNDKAEAEQMWQELVRAQMGSVEGREKFVQLQDLMDARERESEKGVE